MSERGDNANKRFTCTYEFDDSEWTVDVWASTFEEAEMKLRAMGRGTVDKTIGESVMKSGIELLSDERKRQCDAYGYDADHDDQHYDGSLADCAAMIADTTPPNDGPVAEPARPWQYGTADHVKRKYRADRVRQLVIAGALIVAEIERLQRGKH